MTIVGWLLPHAARNAERLLDSPSPRCAQGTVVVEGFLVAFVVVRRASRSLVRSSCPFTPHLRLAQSMDPEGPYPPILHLCLVPSSAHLIVPPAHLHSRIHSKCLHHPPSIIYQLPSAISICTHRYHMHICFMPHTLLVPLSMPLTIYDLSRSAHDRTLDYVVDVRVVFSPCRRQLARLLACACCVGLAATCY